MKFDAIAKAYLIKEAAEVAAKKAAKGWRKIDWDGDVLQRVGLTTYKGSGIGTGLSLFVLGAAVGGIAALMLAPKKGNELRTDVLNYIKKEQDARFGTQTSSTPITGIDVNPNARV